MTDDIKNAAEALKAGGIILYPTDTIWGIGCDATNAHAVKKIFDLKKRDDSKSLIVLVDSISMLERYVEDIPEIAFQLIEVADKPMTIIYPGAKNLAKNVIATDGSIGIRLVQEAFCSKLIQIIRKPLVSTSANLSGQPAPSVFSEIEKEIRMGVDYVVTYRQNDTKISKPSSILKVGIKGEITIIRP